MRTEILMATHQSEPFLEEMLFSLLGQTNNDFHLVISDDCSTDNTVRIIESLAPSFRHPVRLLRRENPSGGAMQNFNYLLEQSEGDYVFLADHDDIWLPEKVERGLSALEQAAAENGSEMPLLLHTDLILIDQTGKEIGPSYWAFKIIDPVVCESLAGALLQPGATGCTIVANRALVDRAGSVPSSAIMHDWWLLLVAAAFGRVLHDPAPQVKYRIHGSNASRPQTAHVTLSSKPLSRAAAIRQGLRRRYGQGRAFRDRFASELPAASAAMVERFTNLPNLPLIIRQLEMARGGFLGSSTWRNFVQLLLA